MKLRNTNKISPLSIPANQPLTIEELKDSISSELGGNPPLWITRRPGKYGVNVYINNAMVLLEQSNFQSKLKVNGETMTQASFLAPSRTCTYFSARETLVSPTYRFIVFFYLIIFYLYHFLIISRKKFTRESVVRRNK